MDTCMYTYPTFCIFCGEKIKENHKIEFVKMKQRNCKIYE